MKFRDQITPQYVRDSLDYEPETGRLFWKVRSDRSEKWNAAWAGLEAGSMTSGYVLIRLSGAKAAFGAHRIAWAHHYGEWPDGEIDHINRIRADNRISNLRIATRSQNMVNTGSRKGSASGLTGVTFHRQSGKWQARICVDYVSRYLGLFDTPEAASKARDAAARAIHGEFARTNS